MAIHIKRVRNLERDGSCDLLAQVESPDGSEDIIFQRHSSVEGLGDSDPRPDAFLLLLIMHAMKNRQDIWVEDPVDPLLLFHLRGEVQTILRLCFPELRTIKIEAVARDASAAVKTAGCIATGFSGGVDSMQMIHQKLCDPSLPPAYQVDMLMHHNVGSVNRQEQYQINCQHTKDFASDFNLAFAGASCNTSKYFAGFSFLETHTLRTSAATLSLFPVFHRYLFASGTDLQVSLASLPSRVLDASNPMLLPLFHTLENNFMQFGGDYTRLEKILEVLSQDSLLPRINVCARVAHDNSRFLNCGRCFKCFPFLLIAEAVGKLNALKNNFDLTTFQKHRPRSLANFLIFALGPKRSQTNRQVAWFLREHGKEFTPKAIRFLMAFVPLPISDSSVQTSLNRLQSSSFLP